MLLYSPTAAGHRRPITRRSWHSVELVVSPQSDGGAFASFIFDGGVYGGSGSIAAWTMPSPAFVGFSGRTGGATNNHWVRHPGLKLKIPAWVFCMSRCPDFEFRVTRAGKLDSLRGVMSLLSSLF